MHVAVTRIGRGYDLHPDTDRLYSYRRSRSALIIMGITFFRSPTMP